MELYSASHVNLMCVCVCEYDIKLLLNGFWIINNFSETRNVEGSKNYNFFPLPRFQIGRLCWLNKLYTASKLTDIEIMEGKTKYIWKGIF